MSGHEQNADDELDRLLGDADADLDRALRRVVDPDAGLGTVLDQAGRASSTQESPRFRKPKRVWPLYLVCDTSASMAGEPIADLNAAIADFLDVVAAEVSGTDVVMVAVIGFGSESRLVLPLTRLDRLTAVPALTAAGVTNYQAAFEMLRDTVTRDVADLRGRGMMRFGRPFVLFISDGRPTDQSGRLAPEDVAWRLLAKQLRDRQQAEIVALGFGHADRAILADIAAGSVVMADAGSPDLRVWLAGTSAAALRKRLRADVQT
ncbi:hypothetical protein B4N89_47300 [Embleya scabrispora]|uniref:VWFA domain-containing protein n=1 Tax=Embleya scabrispora TaxID=159449 RepID=A0A1T3NHY1_9ACTN|nr:VWA domain-containing protein [Embleya scabrispora]OPC76419.1 hypothetical protein B4N89_47300 [Embleya scabrispora]